MLDALKTRVPDVKATDGRELWVLWRFGGTLAGVVDCEAARGLGGLRRSRHRACHEPLVPLEPISALSSVTFTQLAATPVPGQLSRCSIELKGRVNDWATNNRRAFVTLMCRELSPVPTCLRCPIGGFPRG